MCEIVSWTSTNATNAVPPAEIIRQLRWRPRCRGRKPPAVPGKPACVVYGVVNPERLDVLLPTISERCIQPATRFRTLVSNTRNETGSGDKARRPDRAVVRFSDPQHATKSPLGMQRK